MKITKIGCENFMCYKKMEIEIKNNTSIFAGQPRIGKTAILKMIKFLFQKRVSEEMNLSIKKGSRKATIEAQIEHEGGVFSLKRTFGSSGGFFLDGNKTTLENVVETLGLTDGFFRAFDPDVSFSKLTNKQLQEILLETIELPEWYNPDFLAEIDAKIKVAKKRAETSETEYNSQKEQYDEIVQYYSEDTNEEKAGEISSKIDKLKEKIKEYEEESVKKNSNSDKGVKKTNVIRKEIGELNQKKGETMKKIGVLEGKENEIKRIGTLVKEKGNCPYCGTKDNGEIVPRLREGFSKVDSEMKNRKSELDIIIKTIEEKDNLMDQVCEYNDKLNKEIRAMDKELKAFRNELTILEKELAEANDSGKFLAKELEEKLENFKIKMEENKKLFQELFDKKQEFLKKDIPKLEEEISKQLSTIFFEKVKVNLTKELSSGELKDDFKVTYNGIDRDTLSGSETIFSNLELAARMSPVIIIDEFEKGTMEDLDKVRKFADEKGVQILGTMVVPSQKELTVI